MSRTSTCTTDRYHSIPKAHPKHARKTCSKGTQKGRIKNISSKNDDINVNNSCDDSDDSVSLLNENPAQCYGCQKNYPRQKMVFVVIFASTGSAVNALNLRKWSIEP